MEARPTEPVRSGEPPTGPLSTNLLWNFGSDLAARGASLWLTFFCARILTVADFGLFAFAQAVGQYAWLPGDAVLNNAYATREIARARAAPRRVAWDFYGARLSAALLLTGVYIVAVLALPMPSAERTVLLAASLYFVSYALFPDWAARGLQDFRALAAGNGAIAVALVGSTWFLLSARPSPSLATALWAVSFAAGAAVLAPLLARSFRLLPARFEPRAWIRHARLSVAFSIGGVLAVGIGQAPTILLGVLCPPHEVGLFAAGFRLVSMGLGLLGVLWWPVFPVLSTTPTTSPAFRELFRVFFTILVGLSLPLALALGTFPLEILRALFGSAYAEGAGALHLLAWALPLFGAVTVLEITLLAAGGEVSRMWVNGVALATLVAGTLALAPRYGALGAASALLAGLAVALVGFSIALRGKVSPAWVVGPLARMLASSVAVGILWIGALRAGIGTVPVLLTLGLGGYVLLMASLGLGPGPLWRSLHRTRPSAQRSGTGR